MSENQIKSRTQLAILMGKSESSISRWMKAGCPYTVVCDNTLRKRPMFNVDEVQEWLASQDRRATYGKRKGGESMSKNLFMDGRTMRAIFCNLKKARQQLGLELGIPLDRTDMTMAHFTAPRALVYIYEVLVLAERLLQHYWGENKEA